MIKTVGILGYGSFGQFLHTLAQTHLPDVQVKIWNRKQEPDTKLFFDFKEVCACDVLVFAVSISALEEIIARAVPCIGADTVLVDVATVKTHPVALFQKYASEKKYIATHPMFGPYSFEKKGKSLVC
jgi:prephenate dehydrogenase